MTPQLIRLFGDIFDLVGTLLIAYAALSVHHRFRHEHKVDDQVFDAMRLEIKLGFLGIGMIILGFIGKVAADFLI